MRRSFPASAVFATMKKEAVFCQRLEKLGGFWKHPIHALRFGSETNQFSGWFRALHKFFSSSAERLQLELFVRFRKEGDFRTRTSRWNSFAFQIHSNSPINWAETHLHSDSSKTRNFCFWVLLRLGNISKKFRYISVSQAQFEYRSSNDKIQDAE